MAVEQVAGIFVGSGREEVAILLLVKGIVLLCVAVSITATKDESCFNGIMDRERMTVVSLSRRESSVCVPERYRSRGRARILDVARAYLSPKNAKGQTRRGQSAPKERTDISRRKRRFRVVVPLFAVGIIIGLPGNPGGRRGGWCGSGFVVGFYSTTVRRRKSDERGRRWQKGESMGEARRGWRDEGDG